MSHHIAPMMPPIVPQTPRVEQARPRERSREGRGSGLDDETISDEEAIYRVSAVAGEPERRGRSKRQKARARRQVAAASEPLTDEVLRTLLLAQEVDAAP